jgi:hypothetical protein
MRTKMLAIVAVLTLFAAPAMADGHELAEEPVLYEPCTDTDGFDAVITLEEGFNGTVPTPVEPLLLSEEDAGRYLLDLGGLEEGTRSRVTFTLEWDTPLGLGDYDLLINGSNDEVIGDSPETHVLSNQTHCRAFDLATTSFSGTPLDTLTLTITAG